MEIMVNSYRTLPVIGRFHDKLKLARKERDGALRDLTEARDQFSRLHKEMRDPSVPVELRYRDLMIAIGYDGSFIPAAKALLRTSHPLAANSTIIYIRAVRKMTIRVYRGSSLLAKSGLVARSHTLISDAPEVASSWISFSVGTQLTGSKAAIIRSWRNARNGDFSATISSRPTSRNLSNW